MSKMFFMVPYKFKNILFKQQFWPTFDNCIYKYLLKLLISQVSCEKTFSKLNYILNRLPRILLQDTDGTRKKYFEENMCSINRKLFGEKSELYKTLMFCSNFLVILGNLNR